LLAALKQIGLSASAEKRTAGAAAVGPVCFEVPSDYEIAVGGKKLIGSAQVRRQNATLQHGSLPLHGDVSRICDALVFQDESARHDARSRVLERATTLADALGHSVSWDRVARAVYSGFSTTFSLSLDEAPLTPAEKQRALELRAKRYANRDWNLRL
jgi:lipoate-protein ligase A